MLNWETKQLSVSRNVVFHETNFPFHSLLVSQHALDGTHLPMSTGQIFVDNSNDSSHTKAEADNSDSDEF